MAIHITYDAAGKAVYRTLDGQIIDTPATRNHAALTEEMARERIKEIQHGTRHEHDADQREARLAD